MNNPSLSEIFLACSSLTPGRRIPGGIRPVTIELLALQRGYCLRESGSR
jgi:hypothetical protein